MSHLVFIVLLGSHVICCCITVYLSSSYFMSLDQTQQNIARARNETAHYIKWDESETKIFATDSVHGQSTLHDLILQTRILKITFECAVIAPTNCVNLTTGGRWGKRTLNS